MEISRDEDIVRPSFEAHWTTLRVVESSPPITVRRSSNGSGIEVLSISVCMVDEDLLSASKEEGSIEAVIAPVLKRRASSIGNDFSVCVWAQVP